MSDNIFVEWPRKKQKYRRLTMNRDFKTAGGCLESCIDGKNIHILSQHTRPVNK